MRCFACGREKVCKPDCQVYLKLKEFSPKISDEFSGSSPPEIFVGRYGYPNVNAGILSPAIFGDTSVTSMPELWFKNHLDIPNILALRSSLVYSRFKAQINLQQKERNLLTMQEVAMAANPTDMEFKLQKKPSLKSRFDDVMPMIGNPAILTSAKFQENVKIEKKVDYLSNDTDAKASNAMQELFKSGIPTSSIIKILSAGVLGRRKRRKLVPTRWATTAVDSNLSDILLDRIRHYPLLQEFRLFNSEYLGNHYELLLMPEQFSYEVIEAKMSRSIWNPGQQTNIMKDHEGYFGRKEYAFEVSGGYYAVRLPTAEYLESIQRQASVLVFRECRPEYAFPCGVGILREIARNAFSKKPEVFQDISSAFRQMQTRMRMPVDVFRNESFLLKERSAQKKIFNFI